MMVNLAWGQKVSPEFANKLFTMVNDFSWSNDHASWLMACMAFETGETFSPSIRSRSGSGATGLIQFMESTAVAMGTTTQQLARMSNIQQLDYVKKYFGPYHSRIKSLDDMYMAILYPKYIGADPSQVVFREGGPAYRQNAGLDTNKDGIITKAEICLIIQTKYAKGMTPRFVREFTIGSMV